MKVVKLGPDAIMSVIEKKEPGVVVCITRDKREFIVRASENAGMLPKVGITIRGFKHEEVVRC